MVLSSNSLEKDALEVRRLNRLMVKAVIESDLSYLQEILSEYVETRKRIKIRLLEIPTPKIHDKEALAILQRLSEGKKLPADNIINAMQDMTGIQGNLTALAEEDIESLGSDLFYSWFSHYEYIEGLYEIGSLVVSISVPDHLSKFVDEAKSCYAFQQYNAVYSLCRTILESCVRDICFRCRLIRQRQNNIIPLEAYWWKDLKNAVANGPLKKQIGILYAELSSLIHGRKVASRTAARMAFESTLKTVHALYSYHGF